MPKAHPISGASSKLPARGYAIHCPACENAHVFYVPEWTFNGDVERPTFTPSMLVYAHQVNGDELPGWKLQVRCHSFVSDGQIQYLGDCEHDFAGKTVPLPEFSL